MRIEGTSYIKRQLKIALKKWLLKRDMLISRPPGQYFAHGYRLCRARDLGLKVGFAIDVGASCGNWARMFKGVFESAKILCVEPREEEQNRLKALQEELQGITIGRNLLGPAEGVAELYVHGEQSSVMPNSQGLRFGTVVRMPVTTLDRLLTRTGLPWPDYIKVDVQGAELLILAGAPQSLSHASAVQLEVSLMPFQRGQPCIVEVLAFMKEHGFVSYDLLSSTVRPLDGAWAQTDILFVKENNPLRADARWGTDSVWA